MKYCIASDIHGSAAWCKLLLERFEEEDADKLVLLGDLLYHGPRNDFPDDYDTKTVYAMLNAVKDKLLCVRGNCDSEVDQMVLEFPMLADYAVAEHFGRTLFFTHGHLFNAERPPLLQKGDILFNGHFHAPTVKELAGGSLYVNCGSVALPKEGTPHSYLVLEGDSLYYKDLETGGIFDCVSLS